MRRQAVVAEVNADGTVDLSIPAPGGVINVEGVAMQRSASPTPFSTVWVEFSGTDPHISGALGPPSWVNVSFAAGASDDDPTNHNSTQYTMLPGGVVLLRGRVLLGAASVGAVIFTLGLGYRPKKITSLRVPHYTGTTWELGIVNVEPDGDVSVVQATNSEKLILDGTQFSIW